MGQVVANAGEQTAVVTLAAPLAGLAVRARQLQQMGQPADAQLVPCGVHRGGAGQFGPDHCLDKSGAPLDVAFDDGGVERLDGLDVQHSLQVDVLDGHGKVSPAGWPVATRDAHPASADAGR